SDIESEVDGKQMTEFDRENRLVPSCLFGQLVISQDVGPDLFFAEVLKTNRGHLLDAQEFCCKSAAVAGDDCVVLIDQNRVVKSKCDDAVRDLADLLLRVRSGVARIGFQLSNTLLNHRQDVAVLRTHCFSCLKSSLRTHASFASAQSRIVGGWG